MTSRADLQAAFLAHRRSEGIAASRVLIAEHADDAVEGAATLDDVPADSYDELHAEFIANTSDAGDVPDPLHVAAADLTREMQQYAADHGADALVALCGAADATGVPDTERFAVLTTVLAANAQTMSRTKQTRRFAAIGTAAFARRAAPRPRSV